MSVPGDGFAAIAIFVSFLGTVCTVSMFRNRQPEEKSPPKRAGWGRESPRIIGYRRKSPGFYGPSVKDKTKVYIKHIMEN